MNSTETKTLSAALPPEPIVETAPAAPVAEKKGPCDVLVIGGANTDYLVRGGRFPAPGETLPGERFLEAPGGKGANQAVTIARLGGRPGLIGRVGSDVRGAALVEQIQSEGVDVRHVTRDPELSTGVALILVDGAGEKEIVAVPGANHGLREDDVLAARGDIASAKVVLAQLEVPLEVVLGGLRAAREAGATTILDLAPATPLPDELIELVDVLRPNSTEATVLTGVRVDSRASAARAARMLLERGARAVIVQAGEEGDLLVTREFERLLPRFSVETVDATGAGDAFAGALALELSEGRSLPDAARFASAAAALATTKLGAQTGLPTRAEVRALLAQGEGRDVAPSSRR